MEELVLGLLWRDQGGKSVDGARALQAEGELGQEASAGGEAWAWQGWREEA